MCLTYSFIWSLLKQVYALFLTVPAGWFILWSLVCDRWKQTFATRTWFGQSGPWCHSTHDWAFLGVTKLPSTLLSMTELPLVECWWWVGLNCLCWVHWKPWDYWELADGDIKSPCSREKVYMKNTLFALCTGAVCSWSETNWKVLIKGTWLWISTEPRGGWVMTPQGLNVWDEDSSVCPPCLVPGAGSWFWGEASEEKQYKIMNMKWGVR